MFDKAFDLIGILMIAFIAWPIVMLLPGIPLSIFAVSTGVYVAPWFVGVCGIPLALYVGRAFWEMV